MHHLQSSKPSPHSGSGGGTARAPKNYGSKN
jgi:hypothetical protein